MRKLILAILPIGLLAGCGEPKTIAEEFPGQWQEATPDVMRTLAQNQVRGCGDFYQKPAAEYLGEYVVACSRDGQTWVVWRVWTGSNEVLGPDASAIGQLGGPPKQYSN